MSQDNAQNQPLRAQGYQLYQNLKDLNIISDRLLNDYKTKNEILRGGLSECATCNNLVTEMKGGAKKNKRTI